MPRDRILPDKLNLRVQRPRHIIFTTLHNLMVKGMYFPPAFLKGNYKYSFSTVEDYFYYTLQNKSLPFHFYVEFLEKDYAAFLGAPYTNSSWFIQKLVDNGCINYMYNDAFLVVVQEDWRLEIPERRLLEFLANFIFTPLMKEYKIRKEDVIFLDDIILPNTENKMIQNKSLLDRFMLEKSKYYDHNIMIMALNKYIKRR
jgi:hypothetical protein